MEKEQEKLENDNNSLNDNDLINEFSSNDTPFSLGLLRLKSKTDRVLIYFGNKSLISDNLPILFVPIKRFLIFFI